MSKLTAKDIQRFERRLRRRRQELLEHIRAALVENNRRDFAVLADRVRDVGDEAAADLFIDIDLAAVELEVNELRDIEAALARIGAGTYGQCQECGGEIERERLEAYPTAKRCIEDQRRTRRAAPAAATQPGAYKIRITFGTTDEHR